MMKERGKKLVQQIDYYIIYIFHCINALKSYLKLQAYTRL